MIRGSVPAFAAVLLGVLAAAAAPAANRGIVHLVQNTENSSILPAGDVDTYVCNLPAGALLSAKVKAVKGVPLLPALSFADPDGVPVTPTALAAAKYKPGKSSVAVKNLPLPSTGLWAISISGFGAGQAGGYSLSTKVKYPKPLKVKGVVLPGGKYGTRPVFSGLPHNHR